MMKTTTGKRRRGSIAILGLFFVLFGAGIFVYGVAHGRPAMPDSARHQGQRTRMVEAQITGRDVTDQRVVRAMLTVPRHLFVPPAERKRAYDDRPLPIGHDQTISQPYMVAAMAQLASLDPNEKVLEVGTGSGYGAAVLGEVAAEVHSIEIVEVLAKRAEVTLANLGYDNVTVHYGDGYGGLADQAPFDAIVVTAAPAKVPPALLEQLAVGGRLVIPVGTDRQKLEVYERGADGVTKYDVFDVSFVPMTGKARAVR